MVRRLAGFTVAGLLFTATPGTAEVILTSPSVEYQMSSQSPCVIGGSQCNSGEPDGFGFTLLPEGGGSGTYDAISPLYTALDIETFVGTSFLVGIDVNSTAGDEDTPATETLQFFGMYVNGVLVDWFGSEVVGPGSSLYLPRNGTGWSDAILTSLLFTVAGLNDDDTVQFKAIINTATDGRENIFLIETTTPPCETDCETVPEPASLALLGMGALAAGIARRRLRR